MPKGVECMDTFSIKPQKQVAPSCGMNFLPSSMRKFKLQTKSKKGQRIANFRMRLEKLSAEIDHNVSNKMNSLSHSLYPWRGLSSGNEGVSSCLLQCYPGFTHIQSYVLRYGLHVQRKSSQFGSLKNFLDQTVEHTLMKTMMEKTVILHRLLES